MPSPSGLTRHATHTTWLLLSSLLVSFVGCAEGRHGGLATLEPRAFGGLPLEAPVTVTDGVRLIRLGEIGTIEGPAAFGGIMSAALNPADSALAVLDSHDCSVTLVSASRFEVKARFGNCGNGPNELTSPTRMAFVRDSLLIFDPGRSRFAMVPTDEGPYRWFESEVLDENGRTLSQLSQATD